MIDFSVRGPRRTECRENYGQPSVVNCFNHADCAHFVRDQRESTGTTMNVRPDSRCFRKTKLPHVLFLFFRRVSSQSTKPNTTRLTGQNTPIDFPCLAVAIRVLNGADGSKTDKNNLRLRVVLGFCFASAAPTVQVFGPCSDFD